MLFTWLHVVYVVYISCACDVYVFLYFCYILIKHAKITGQGSGPRTRMTQGSKERFILATPDAYPLPNEYFSASSFLLRPSPQLQITHPSLSTKTFSILRAPGQQHHLQGTFSTSLARNELLLAQSELEPQSALLPFLRSQLWGSRKWEKHHTCQWRVMNEVSWYHNHVNISTS